MAVVTHLSSPCTRLRPQHVLANASFMFNKSVPEKWKVHLCPVLGARNKWKVCAGSTQVSLDLLVLTLSSCLLTTAR